MSALLDHLQRQLESSRRLLAIVLSQSAAIRRRDVETVLASLSEVQAEMSYRGRLEIEREALLRSAATTRGVAPETLDLEAMLVGVPEAEANEARVRSAELIGLVTETGRVHEQNRLLLRQELTFLDHLMRVLSGTPKAGYSPTGWAPAPAGLNVVDARA
ncbi:MAG TPA: flagellar export chaperone FlgN [Gaiellaceae bacterium]|nr:flagellar export chaperone FlgN [Gaiellaceae bacterium]